MTAYDEMLRSMERRVFPLARSFPTSIARWWPAEPYRNSINWIKTPFELQAPDWQEE